MMVLALPFAYFQRRSGGIGFRVFSGTILGLLFFLMVRLFSHLGVINDWPPLFSAAFPVFVFVAVAVSMLWWLERRWPVTTAASGRCARRSCGRRPRP